MVKGVWNDADGVAGSQRVLDSGLLEMGICKRVDIQVPVGKLELKASGRDSLYYDVCAPESLRAGLRVKTVVNRDQINLLVVLDRGEAGKDPSWWDRCRDWYAGTRVLVTVSLPSGKMISASSQGGDIKLSRLSGQAFLMTSSGGIAVEHFSGELNAATGSGSCRVLDARGKMTLETVNGDIAVQGNPERVWANSESGDISCQFDEPPRDRSVVRLTTARGDVTCLVPEDSRVAISWKTETGDCGVPDNVQCKWLGKTGGKVVLNEEAAKVALSSSSGYIRVDTLPASGTTPEGVARLADASR